MRDLFLQFVFYGEVGTLPSKCGRCLVRGGEGKGKGRGVRKEGNCTVLSIPFFVPATQARTCYKANSFTWLH